MIINYFQNIWLKFKYLTKENIFGETFRLFLIISIFFSIIFSFNFINNGEQQFSYLADSFLHNKLYFIEALPSSGDMAFSNGKFYWPLGLFPAVILMPFVFIFKVLGLFFYQGYLNFILVILTFLVVFRIGIKLNYSKIDSLFLAVAFCFASAYLGVAAITWSWYFAHVITVLLIFLSISEYLTKKRYWLIGLLFGLIFLTRATAGVGIVFFILDIFSAKNTFKHKIKNLINLAAPFASMVLIYFMYNYLRFENILEQGYSTQIFGENLTKARSYGLFNLIHLPGNLYYLFLSMPSPVFRDSISHALKFPFIKVDPWGMSIFLTSPYLFYLLFLKYENKTSYFLMFTITLIALPILLFFGVGVRQFGYRFALDFMPFLFLLFMINYKEQKNHLSDKLKILIVIAAVFNLYLLFTIFLCPG